MEYREAVGSGSDSSVLHSWYRRCSASCARRCQPWSAVAGGSSRPRSAFSSAHDPSHSSLRRYR